MALSGIRFVEGAHYTDSQAEVPRGGWLESLHAEIRVDGDWVAVETPPVGGPPQAEIAFEIVQWILDAPRNATGVRIRGVPGRTGGDEGDGGDGGFATIAEIEGILASSEADM